MTQIIDTATNYFSSLNSDQLVALGLLFLAISCAKTIVEGALSVAFTVAGLMAALYFVAPELYQVAYDMLLNIINAIASAI